MRSHRLGLFFALACLLASGSGPGLAGSGAAETVVASGGGPGSGWATLTLLVERDAKATFYIESHGGTRPNHERILLLHENGTEMAGYSYYHFDNDLATTALTTRPDGRLRGVSYHFSPDQAQNYYGEISGSFSEAGVYHAVLYATGENDRWNWRVTTDGGGVAVLGVAEGDRTFLVNISEWRHGASVFTHVEAFAARAVVAEGARVTVDVRDNLIGGLAVPFSGRGRAVGLDPLVRNDLRVDAPSGTIRCPCDFTSLGAGEAAGPGSYTFRWDGVLLNAGRALADVFLDGADVRLPHDRASTTGALADSPRDGTTAS